MLLLLAVLLAITPHWFFALVSFVSSVGTGYTSYRFAGGRSNLAIYETMDLFQVLRVRGRR